MKQCDNMSKRKISYGALLYTVINGRKKIILGREYGQYSLFRGGKEGEETDEESAIREVLEETCGVVKIRRLPFEYKGEGFDCNDVPLKGKIWYIGFVYVNPTICYQYLEARRNLIAQAQQELLKSPNRQIQIRMRMRRMLEKTQLKMFDCENYLNHPEIAHPKTYSVVKHFYSAFPNERRM